MKIYSYAAVGGSCIELGRLWVSGIIAMIKLINFKGSDKLPNSKQHHLLSIL